MHQPEDRAREEQPGDLADPALEDVLEDATEHQLLDEAHEPDHDHRDERHVPEVPDRDQGIRLQDEVLDLGHGGRQGNDDREAQ